MYLVIVEDDVRLARSIQRNLQDEHHIVELFHDGDMAYERITENPDHIDAILLDILIPGRNGIALCRDLRRAGIQVPILLLTALEQTEEKVAGLDAGADDYLIKPIPTAELLARLRAQARRARRFDTTPTAELHAGDLVIDLLRHEVHRGGDAITLTAREFALLEYLVRNTNQVLTRQQLTARVWPDGTEAGSNVLDTYIHYLREKIDRDYEPKLIQTIRGVGYLLRVPQQ